MIGIEFGAPRSLKLKASWNMLETANKGLFCQLITIPLFKEHKILTQVAGHASHTIKLLPPLIITEEDCDWIIYGVRRRHRRQPSGAGRRLVARQDPDRARGPRPGQRMIPKSGNWFSDQIMRRNRVSRSGTERALARAARQCARIASIKSLVHNPKGRRL